MSLGSVSQGETLAELGDTEMQLSSRIEKAADSIAPVSFHGSSQYLPDLNRGSITFARPKPFLSLVPSNRVMKVEEVDLSYSKPANITSDSASRSNSKYCDWDPDRYKRSNLCRDEAGNFCCAETSNLHRNEKGTTNGYEASSRPNFVQSDPPIGKGQSVCTYPGCGRTFGRSSDLKRHERQHNPKKEFSCPNCEYRSHRKDHLTQHKLKKHKAAGIEPAHSKSDFSNGKRSNSGPKNLVPNRRAGAGMATPLYADEHIHVPLSPRLEFDRQEAQVLDLLQTDKMQIEGVQTPSPDDLNNMEADVETTREDPQPSRVIRRVKPTQVTGEQPIGPAINAFALGIRPSSMDYWPPPALNELKNPGNTGKSPSTKQ